MGVYKKVKESSNLASAKIQHHHYFEPGRVVEFGCWEFLLSHHNDHASNIESEREAQGW